MGRPTFQDAGGSTCGQCRGGGGGTVSLLTCPHSKTHLGSVPLGTPCRAGGRTELPERLLGGNITYSEGGVSLVESNWKLLSLPKKGQTKFPKL